MDATNDGEERRNLVYLVLLGTTLGITVGAIPGLTGTMLIALSLPLTFSMEPVSGLVLLVAMYVGAVSGGLISATLLRMPGTPAAIMTTLDGFPMATSGQPGRALGLGVGASLVGGLVSWFALWQLSEPMADLSTKLGPFELFSMVILALAMLAGIGDSTRARGLLAPLRADGRRGRRTQRAHVAAENGCDTCATCRRQLPWPR